MRLIALIVVVLALAGCMKPSDMQKEARYYLGDAGLMDHYQIHRSANRKLQSDSRLYIAQGHFVPIGHPYARPNIVAEEAFAAAVKVFPLVQRAAQPLGLEEALIAARAERSHYLFYTRFAGAREGVGSREQWESNQEWGDIGIDRAVLQLILMETSTGEIVDFVTIESRGGFLQLYKANAEDMLREPLEDYTQRLLGR